MATSKKKSVWSNFKLRMSLFRIWFMKNILVWLQIALIVCLICIMTGNITSETPILGTIVYPFFKPLVDEINEMVATKRIDGLMDFCAASISILTSIGLFLLKARRIAQTDIKSNKLKIAMIQANLYFNEDGRLTKKSEKLTGQDLDGDGKIDDEEKRVTKGLFSGIISAAKELKVIATADFSGTDDEDQENYEQAIMDAGLKESKAALDELDRTFKVGVTNMVTDRVLDNLNDKGAETMKNKNLTEKEKVQKVRLINKLKNWINEKRAAKAEEIKKSNNADVIVNNMEEDATKKVVKVKKEEKRKKEKEKVIESPAPVVQKKTVVTSPSSDVESFLNKIRK